MRPHLLIVGLDCLSPDKAFGWRDRLPTLDRLMAGGVWGPLRSTDPPITVPAWSSMLSGLTPGQLGVYGFKHRPDRGYATALATGRAVRHPRLWDLAGAAGLESLVVGVPQTWPPKPLRGRLVTGLFTPGDEAPFTWPPALAEEVRRRVGRYRFDVEGFRDGDEARVLRDIEAMTEQRLELMAGWLEGGGWDLAVLVEIGPDRLHHRFWGRDEVLLAYYRRLDAGLARLLAAAGDADVMVVSDHGARPMEGGVRLNEWLRREGLLVFREPPAPGAALSDCAVDWRRTRAWADGGYVGRLWLNVAGREPEGVLHPGETEALKARLTAELEALVPGTTVLRPDRLWPDPAGVPPDLMVYFGGLAFRALGTLGGPVLTAENDLGPDAANHDPYGVFVLCTREGGSPSLADRPLEGLEIRDVFATACALLGLDAPAGTGGVSHARLPPPASSRVAAPARRRR